MAHTSSAGVEVSKMNSMGTKSKSTMVERIEYDPYEMPGPYDDDDVHRTHSGRRRSSVNAMPTVSAQFIKRDLHGSFLDGRTVMQSYIYMFLKSPWTTNSLAAITMFDAYLSCVDIDRGAASLPPIAWVSVTTQLCLVLYTVEWLSWLFVRGRRIVKDLMLMMELLIILCGYGELILALTVESVADSIVAFRMLRIARTLRLLKLFRRVGYFKELRKVLTMATTCLRTLLWSFLFCFVVMTFWSMLLVDLVQPLIVDLHESSSTFADCEECVRMSSSVMMANLLLFKTVIAGDSWGLIAVPVIEAHPATAIIFVGSLLTLVFGVLNLIVAVVVDTFAETRQRDVLGMAEELETDFEEDRRLLQRIFDRVDTQGSGQLSLEDLFTAAQEDPELQSRLRVMDIDEADLQQLFEMIDVDGSGTVEKSEFIEPLSRWVHESKTATRFIKYNILRSLHQQERLREITEHRLESVERALQRIAVGIGVPLARQIMKEPVEERPELSKGAQPQAPESQPDVPLRGTSKPKALASHFLERYHLNNIGVSKRRHSDNSASENSSATASLMEVERPVESLDFTMMASFYANRRHAPIPLESAREAHEAAVNRADAAGLVVEGEDEWQAHKQVDGALHGAMQAVQELLLDATTAALTRAEHTLQLRMGALMQTLNGGKVADEEVDGPIRVKSALDHSCPDPSEQPVSPKPSREAEIGPTSVAQPSAHDHPPDEEAKRAEEQLQATREHRSR